MKKCGSFRSIFLFLVVFSLICTSAYAINRSATAVRSMSDYLGTDYVAKLSQAQKNLLDEFKVGEIQQSRSYYVINESSDGDDQITEVSEEYFYTNVIKVTKALSHEDAMKQYYRRVKEAVERQDSGSRGSIADSDEYNGSFFVLTTTMYYSSDTTKYDYMVRNEIECDPYVTKQYALANCITTGANLSIIDDLYITQHSYELIMPDGRYEEISESPNLSVTASNGYGFGITVHPYSLTINNYCQLVVYVHPNVSNLIIADAYGWAAYDQGSSIPSNFSISVGIGGASITISPSPNRWTEAANHMQDERGSR